QKPHRSHPASPGPEPEEADENQPLASVRRSSETPLPFSAHGKPLGTIKKRAVVRLFTDNHSDAAEQLPRPDDPRRRPRPGTPVAHHRVLDSTPVPRTNTRPPTRSRVSLFPSDGYRWAHGSGDCGLDETSSENSFSDTETCSVSSQGGLCDSPPLLPPASCRSRPATDVRSSMPEADLLPTMSARPQDGVEVTSCRSSTSSLFLRSPSSAFSGRQQQHPFNLSKSVNRPIFSSKPPQPPSAKPAAEVKKVNKALGRQEDAHVLRLLDNCYVQWRFLNAKARGWVEARGAVAEVDTRELREVMDSALLMLESLSLGVARFLPKVKECSLRTQLIQVKQRHT
ncbi:hypothetical protein GW17_00033147, partial [Ensete ventricosum]